MRNENAVDSIDKAQEIGDHFLALMFKNQDTKMKVRILYEGDFYWFAYWGTIPFTPLLGNVPFLIRKEDGAIIENLPYDNVADRWELFEEGNELNLLYDAQMIENLKHNHPCWETDDPVVWPRPSGFKQDIKDLISFFKNLFLPKT